MSDLLKSMRKVEDDDDTETRSLQRSRHGHTGPTSAISRRIAEDGSISSLIRHSRKALYVEPIAWTSDHLQSLGCSFDRRKLPRRGREHKQNNTSEEPEYRTAGSLLPDDAARLKCHLARVSTLTVKRYAIKEILEAYNMRPQGSNDLFFRFNHHNVAKLLTDGVFMSSNRLASIAFLTFDTIKFLRERYIEPTKTTSIPVLEKRRSRLRLLEPRDRAEDPYLVAVLIALAQTQRRQQQATQAVNAAAKNSRSRIGGRFRPARVQMRADIRSYNVKVLAIPGTLAKYFYVYTATIPAELLDNFDEPLRYIPTSPISIPYYRIPVNSGTSLEKLYSLLYAGPSV